MSKVITLKAVEEAEYSNRSRSSPKKGPSSRPTLDDDVTDMIKSHSNNNTNQDFILATL